MATKAQVLKRAEQLGCLVEMDGMGIAVVAPRGYLLGGEFHNSCFDWDCYSKSEIWSNLLDEMSTGLEPCEGSRFCDCVEQNA